LCAEETRLSFISLGLKARGMKPLSLILILVLSGGVLLGEDASSWRKDGEPVADAPNMKSANGFGAQLFLTENAKFFEDWSKPETPKLTPLKTAHRNVPIFTAILFADPGLDAEGSADVTCDIIVRRPDGSIYGEQKDVIGWKGKYLVPAHNLQLTQGRMGIRIEPQDPSGTFTVEVIVRDHIKKVELSLKEIFEVPQ
jgi:hypothetical protein